VVAVKQLSPPLAKLSGIKPHHKEDREYNSQFNNKVYENLETEKFIKTFTSLCLSLLVNLKSDGIVAASSV
jgi:hypothetical protein